MLSRCCDVNDMYIDKLFDLQKINPSPIAFREHQQLEERSIVSEYHALENDLFLANCHSKLILKTCPKICMHTSPKNLSS